MGKKAYLIQQTRVCRFVFRTPRNPQLDLPALPHRKDINVHAVRGDAKIRNGAPFDPEHRVALKLLSDRLEFPPAIQASELRDQS